MSLPNDAARNGVIAVLLESIRGSSDDGNTLVALLALQGYCRGDDNKVRASLEAEDGFALLSEMTISSNDKIQVLGRAILSDLLAGESERERCRESRRMKA
jgi:hypothetical protein